MTGGGGGGGGGGVGKLFPVSFIVDGSFWPGGTFIVRIVESEFWKPVEFHFCFCLFLYSKFIHDMK